MRKIEKVLLSVLTLLAAASLVDLFLDYRLFWVHQGGEGPDDLAIHLVLLALLSVSLYLARQLVFSRRLCESELHIAVAEAGQEHARAEAIIAAMGDGVSIQDKDFRVLFQNARHLELAGQEAVGEFCYKVYAQREDLCPACPVKDAFKDGKVHRLVKQMPPGRSASHVEIMASPLLNPAGEIVAGIELVRDVSLQYQRDQQIQELNLELENHAKDLAHLNEELEAFGYSLAHDLGSQLTPLVLASETLHLGYRSQLDERGQQLLDNLRISSDQMSLMLEGMLVLGRVRRQEMVYEEFDISALASSVQNSLPGGRRSDRIDWQIEDGLKAWGDERLIRIVLQNLLGNALKYSGKEANACIRFGATEHRGELCFYVADNGVGFSEEEAETLFQPFCRLHGEEFPGSGIGLSTVDRVIRRHGGWVAAQASPGDGATFFFTLPSQLSG